MSLSAIKGYRSVLICICKNVLSDIATSDTFHDLVRSFDIQMPLEPPLPFSWDFDKVLEVLRQSPYEPMSSVDLWTLEKTLSRMALGAAKHVGELQVISFHVEIKKGIWSPPIPISFGSRRGQSQGLFLDPLLSSHWLGLWAQKRKNIFFCPVK